MTYKTRVDQSSFNMEDCKLSLRLLLLPTHSVPLKYKSVDIKQEHGGVFEIFELFTHAIHEFGVDAQFIH